MAKYPAKIYGSVWHQRHEGGDEWCAQLQNLGRFVGGGSSRGSDQLAYRIANDQSNDLVQEEAASLYQKLENVTLPMFYQETEAFLKFGVLPSPSTAPTSIATE